MFVILKKFSSLAAHEIVEMTTFSAASDGNVVSVPTHSYSIEAEWCIYASAIN